MELPLKTRFNEAWEAIVARKRRNTAYLSREAYRIRLRLVRRRKANGGLANNSAKKSKLLRNYDIIIKGGRERLVKPQEGVSPDLFPSYVANDELFDVLTEAYTDKKHGCNAMYNRIRGKYCNVTREAILTYLKLRARFSYPSQEVEMTAAISPGVEQGLLPMPPSSQYHVNGITSVYFGFVDMYRYPRDGYTCIMVHWDTDTRFTQMVPLPSMDPVHVADGLLKIYAKVGIPTFIDAPYDAPYITSIIDRIKSMWRGENCCITIKRSEDQNSIVTGWNAVQQTVEPWMDRPIFQDNWPSKLKYIQNITNNSNPSGSTLPPSDISSLNFDPSVCL